MGNENGRVMFIHSFPASKETQTHDLWLTSPTLFFIETSMELFSKNVHTVISINSKRTAAYPELG